MEERREWQKKIFGMARSVGITDNDDLHALISCACGKSSLKEIDKQDYTLIIRELKKRSSASYKPKKSKALSKTRAVSGMSEGQTKKVWQLMYGLKKYDHQESESTLGKRLCGIIKRELQTDALPEEPFVWLTYKNGITLIERLKRYVENAEKRYLRGV